MSTTRVDGEVKGGLVYISTGLDCSCDERFNGTEKKCEICGFFSAPE